MKEKYKIIADPDYGFQRIEPIPSQDEVKEFYSKEFYSSANKRFNDSSLEVQKEEREFFNSRWESIYNQCIEHFGKTGGFSLFDIGFGFAQSLLFFKQKGIQVSGLEPSIEGAEYARKQGLEVYNTDIEDFSCVGNRRFDVVTLLNVLEHLRFPAKTLADIRKKLLKPGGLLVIDVPNDFNDFQTTADTEFSLDKWWLCPPAHINYFSVTTLCNLLQKCGYSIVHKESSFPLEIFLLMGDVYVGKGELGKICHERRVKFENLMRKHGKGKKLSLFYQALAELDLGRQITVFATVK